VASQSASLAYKPCFSSLESGESLFIGVCLRYPRDHGPLRLNLSSRDGNSDILNPIILCPKWFPLKIASRNQIFWQLPSSWNQEKRFNHRSHIQVYHDRFKGKPKMVQLCCIRTPSNCDLAFLRSVQEGRNKVELSLNCLQTRFLLRRRSTIPLCSFADD
jgi:hypothetical protein